MIHPTQEDVGRHVIYTRNRQPDGSGAERGVITSVSESFIFVRYSTTGGGIATRREDLEWES